MSSSRKNEAFHLEGGQGDLIVNSQKGDDAFPLYEVAIYLSSFTADEFFSLWSDLANAVAIVYAMDWGVSKKIVLARMLSASAKHTRRPFKKETSSAQDETEEVSSDLEDGSVLVE